MNPLDGNQPESRHRSAPAAWRSLGEHRFRTPAATLIDDPLEATVWVATIWPAPATNTGWQRSLWIARPDARGWVLPADLALGDIVEFGGDTAGRIARWHGIVDTYEPDRWLTLIGPYDTPATAYRRATELLAPIQHLTLGGQTVDRTRRRQRCTTHCDRQRH